MNAYIEPLIDELLKSWARIRMYDISRPIGKKQFQFHGILACTICCNLTDHKGLPIIHI